MSAKVAIVTGANKGVGFAIVRGLCKRFNGIVYLTSRDVTRGQKAVADLQKEGLKPKYHQLDITDPASIETFRDYLQKTYGGIDVLVNNAAIAFKSSATESAAVQAKETLFVNYFSLVSVCNILFPLLRNGARVVNLSSSAGRLSNIPSETLRNKLKDSGLAVEGLSRLMQDYVDKAQEGTQVAEWGNSSYVVSKVGVTALTRIQQRLLDHKDIKVNAVHPGYVDTDMTSHQGPLTIDQGASSTLYMVLDAPETVRGQFIWEDSKIVEWK